MTSLNTIIGLQNISAGVFGCFGNAESKEQPKNPPVTDRPTATANNVDLHDMDAPNDKWEPANWENGGLFNCAWKKGNITFENGIMSIALKKEKAEKYPYTSGEYRSTSEYGYGHYETRMKAASGDGLVSSFFIYSGIYGKSDHHEIDIEIFGKNPRQAQFNYFVEGKEGKKILVDLPFDASQGFHDYGFKWTDNSLEWFVDGKSFYKVEGKVPYRPGKIMANLWPGTAEASAWIGGPYNGGGTTAQYDWIKASVKQ